MMTSKRWMLIAVTCFCIMAIVIKEMSSAVTSFQIIFFRAVLGLIFLLTFFKNKLSKPTFQMIREHSLRNVFHIIGQYGWIVGILYLPLAEVTAIEFSVPIWVLIIASIILKEKLTVYKVLSILLGFAGVLVMIDVDISQVSFYSFIVLLSAMSYAVTHTATKNLIATYTSLDVVYMMCMIQVPISLCLALYDWSMPTPLDMCLLVLVGLSAIIAHFSMSNAMKVDDVGSVIYLDYFRLPILVAIGVLYYQESFKDVYLVGVVLILFGNWIGKKRKV